ncbi:hypothetical protein ACFX12_030117 [Malus domestica]
MGKRERQKAKLDRDEVSEEERELTNQNPSKSAAEQSSSDDDEANEDISLKIVEKALLMRAAKLASDNNAAVSGEPSGGLVELPSSSSSQEAEVAAAGLETKKVRRKERKKNIKKMKIEDQAVVAKEEEKIEEANAVDLAEAKQLENVEFTDNVVLRKLLRGPRYFDPPDCSWGACFNCGEEGHAAVNCTVAKRKKPCFVCGSLEHNAKHCRKGQDCFICKKGGHHAKDCPEKQNCGLLKSQICLKCGDSGHDMFSCRNDYSTDDLKEIQCYVCKRFGHLCCVKYVDTSPWEVSCYKCGSMGHTGMACVSLRGGETTGFGTPRLCYKCGEGGHIARECASLVNVTLSVHKKIGELPNFSTPVLKRHKERRDYMGFKSAPHDLNKAHERKQTQFEERIFTTPQKAKHRGGWIMDDPGDFSPRKGKKNNWKSPATPSSWGRRVPSLTAGGQASSSRSSKKIWNDSGSPISQGSSKSFQHRYSASRFNNSNGGGFRRNYDWSGNEYNGLY